MTTSNFKCPICNEFMLSIPSNETNITRRGFILRCDNKNCLPNENVYGFGETEKGAFEVACQKYKKSLK